MHPILADRQRLVLHLIAWGLVGAMLGLLARVMMRTPWLESMLFGLPMGLVAAPISLSAWYVCRAMPVSKTAPARLAVTAVIAALITASFWAALGQLWWRALASSGLSYGDVPMRTIMALLVGLGALAYLVAVTVNYLFQAFEDSAALSRRALELQIAQRDAELRVLRAQVDPHFLFNSLNSVAGLIGPDPEKARLMCQRLADFLRDSLKLGGGGPIDLSREIALVEQYLKIEQVRFGARLGVRARVAEDIASVQVPPLILQPLVENAVRHGVATRLDGGTIEIDAYRAGARAVVTVTNPRDPDLARRGTGFGLDIVRRRLSAAFGDRAALAIEPAEESYRVLVTMPIGEGA